MMARIVSKVVILLLLLLLFTHTTFSHDTIDLDDAIPTTTDNVDSYDDLSEPTTNLEADIYETVVEQKTQPVDHGDDLDGLREAIDEEEQYQRDERHTDVIPEAPPETKHQEEVTEAVVVEDAAPRQDATEAPQDDTSLQPEEHASEPYESIANTEVPDSESIVEEEIPEEEVMTETAATEPEEETFPEELMAGTPEREEPVESTASDNIVEKEVVESEEETQTINEVQDEAFEEPDMEEDSDIYESHSEPEIQKEQPSEPVAQKKKEGSLASFFEKVSKKETDEPTKNSFEAANDFHKAQQPPPIDEDFPKPYCGVWGKYEPHRRRANLSLLFDLFQDMFVAELQSMGMQDQVNMEEMAAKLTEEAEAAGTSLPPRKPARKPDVNTEFVEGLDDIDAFFEGVDPPDELDVGAAGSSIQEVLMGQGRRILVKRVQMAGRAIRDLAIQAKDVVLQKSEQVWELIQQIERDDIERVASNAWDHLKRLGETVQGLIDRVMDGGDDEDEEFEFTPPTATGGQSEFERMRQMLRQQDEMDEQ